ncbi:hypothetical protein ACFLUV_01660 [Elusimicrobiota bacterium]
MKNNKCVNCSELKRCRSSRASWIFIIIGLIASISIRLITVLIHIDPVYGKIAWYVGVSGFFIFFVYKYKIFKSRARIIEEKDLINKVGKGSQLNEEDTNVISNILCGISSVKERINFLFIFALSAVAIIIAVILDVFK